jgi:alkylhydroperoxidase/carboxymuconolactone decarboxylase family protein YurZ
MEAPAASQMCAATPLLPPGTRWQLLTLRWRREPGGRRSGIFAPCENTLPEDGMGSALSKKALRTLRAHYDRDRMIDNAVVVVGGIFEGGKSWTDAFEMDVYRTDRMKARNRERILISTFTAQGERTALAIHVYWGLMEGIQPDEIQQIVLLSGTYNGLGRYTFGMLTVLDTFNKLAEWAHSIDEPTEKAITDKLLGR